MANRKLTSAKKTTITVEVAEELETYLGEILSGDGFGNPRRDAQDLMRQTGVPKDVSKNIFARLDSIGQDLSNLREGDVERTFIDGVSEDLKRLDEYLGAVFNVIDTRNRRKYVWEVWG